MTQDALLTLFFFSYQGPSAFETTGAHYGNPEEHEVRQLATFLGAARGRYAAPSPGVIRVSRALRIFIGDKELKMRPMAKTVLLLFLKHPEGIVLKRIGDYKAEMEADYRRVSRSSSPEEIEMRIGRLLDIFSNELNVNISRVNAALSGLVPIAEESKYLVSGRAGKPKSILLDRTLVIWE